MKEKKDEHVVFSYSDVFFSYHFSDDRTCSKMAHEHYLVYIYSGEYHINEVGQKKIIIRPGECVFLRRNHRIDMEKLSKGDEPFRGIFMNLKRSFLREVFPKIKKTDFPNADSLKLKNVLPITDKPEITSLFLSLTPYFDQSVTPSPDVMYIKQVEAVYSLLSSDKRFYPILFDFNEPWKIDLIEFMEQNYMYDLSMEEFASFTGRSLSTFKRDFKKVSNLPPQKWLIKKRLEVAYDLIKENGKRVSDVYVEVGFKNLSHFSLAFKKQYGFSPANS